MPRHRSSGVEHGRRNDTEYPLAVAELKRLENAARPVGQRNAHPGANARARRAV